MQEDTFYVCRDLIRQGKIGQALEVLSDFCRQNGYPALNDVLLLSGQYQQHRKNTALGLSTGTVEENRIAKAVLETLDMLEDRRNWPVRPQKSWFYLFATASVILLIFVIKLLMVLGSNTTHGSQSPIIQGNQTTLEYNNNLDTNAVPEQK